MNVRHLFEAGQQPDVPAAAAPADAGSIRFVEAALAEARRRLREAERNTAECEAQIEELRGLYHGAAAEANARREAQTAALRAWCDGEIAGLRGELAVVTARHADEAAAAQARHAEEIAAVEARHAEETAAAEARHAEETATTAAGHAAETAAAAREHAQQLAGAAADREALNRQAEAVVEELATRLKAVTTELAARTAERDHLSDELTGVRGSLEASQLRLRDESAAHVSAEGRVVALQDELEQMRFEVMDRASDRARPRGLFRKPREMAPTRRAQSAVAPKREKEPPPPPPATDTELDAVLERRLFGD